jgi:hypothetical protein
MFSELVAFWPWGMVKNDFIWEMSAEWLLRQENHSVTRGGKAGGVQVLRKKDIYPFPILPFSDKLLRRIWLKEGKVMKKIWIVLLAVSLLGGACATTTKMPLTSTDLSVLKGDWDGIRYLTLNTIQTVTYMELKILNDAIPLKGQVILMPRGETERSYEFDNGQVNAQGILTIPFGDDMRMELSLSKEGDKMKLSGSYFFRMNQGKVELTKK